MKLVDTARQQATSQISTQQQRLAGTLSTVATALQQAGREMRNQDEGPIADYVDTAANQVEQFANMLRDQDLEQLMTTTAQFARRQPALFLGAALRSASPRRASSRARRLAGSGQFGSRDSGLWYERPDGYGSARIAQATATGERLATSATAALLAQPARWEARPTLARAAAWEPLEPWAPEVPLVRAVLAILGDRRGPARMALRVGPTPLDLVARLIPVGPADPPALVAKADLVPEAAPAQGVKGNPDPAPTRVRRGNDGATPR